MSISYPTINILSLGADNSGNTDIAPILISAINQLSANGGGTILFPQGTYLLSGLRIGYFDDIPNKGNVPVIAGCDYLTFEGNGNSVIKLPNNAKNDLFVFRFLNNITFKNLIIDGNANQQSGTSGYKGYWGSDLNGILARDGSRFQAENVQVQNCKKFGINISSDFQDVLISNCIFEHCDTGLDVQGRNMTIKNCKAVNCPTAGIMLEGENSPNDFHSYSGLNSVITVNDNYIKNCPRGIYLIGNAYDIKIHHNSILNSSIWGICLNGTTLTDGKRMDTVSMFNNTIHGCEEGINTAQAINITVDNNIIRKNKLGIYFYDVIESELENNKVKENDGNGISLYDCANLTINGNTVINNNRKTAGKAAGLLVTYGRNFRILNNRFSDIQSIPTQQFGIILEQNPILVSITQNEIKNNVQAPISDWTGGAQYSSTNNDFG